MFEKSENSMFPITESLFAHVNNDPFLTGSHRLEGGHFEDTLGFLKHYINYFYPEGKDLPDDVWQLYSSVDGMAQHNEGLSRCKSKEDVRLLAGEWYQEIEKLKPGENILFPGGWVTSEGGHAMVYEFHRAENNDLIFTIHNSGAGLEYHPKLSSTDKELYSATLQYRIPAAKTGDRPNFEGILQQLIEVKVRGVHKLDEAAAPSYLYEQILTKFSHLDYSQLLPSKADYKYTGGQLSGTCTQRSLHQMLKARFSSLDAYREFIYDFKSYALSLYVNKLKDEGKLSNPKYQSQVEKAIRHQLRLLNVTKQNKPDESLFDDENRERDKERLVGYLTEMHRVRTPEKTPEEPEDEITPHLAQGFEFDITLEEKKETESSPTIKRPLLEKNYPSLNGGASLVDEMQQWYEHYKKIAEDGHPEAAFQALEQFFLSMPLPEQKNAPRLPFYAGIKPEQEQDFFDWMTKLQSLFFDCAQKSADTGGIVLPRMVVIKAIAFAVCGHVCDSSSIPLTAQFHKLIQGLPTALAYHNARTVALATHSPGLDQHLKTIKALYPGRWKYDDSPDKYKGDMLLHYVNIILQFPDLHEELEKRFKEKFDDDDSSMIQQVRDQNCSALYFYLQYKNSRSDLQESKYNKLHSAFKKQKTLEQAYRCGILNLKKRHDNLDMEPKVNYFNNGVRKEIELASLIQDSWLSFQLPRHLQHTLYDLPGGAVRRCLDYSMNQFTGFTFHLPETEMPDSRNIQLKKIGREQGGTGTIQAADLEERELYHLRYDSQTQIMLTLEYFIKHPQKLSRKDMQIYCEANLFEPGLLLNILNESDNQTLWDTFDTMLRKGFEHSDKNGQFTAQSIFYVRIAQAVTGYAFHSDPARYKDRVLNLRQRFNGWIKATQDPSLRAQLHHYRFLSLTALMQKDKEAPDEMDLRDALESLFIMQHNPRPPGCDVPDALYRLAQAKKTFALTLESYQESDLLVQTLNHFKNNHWIADNFPVDKKTQFPVLTFDDKKTGDKYKIDWQRGVIFKNNKMKTHTPPAILSHPMTAQLQLQNVKQCLISGDSRQYILEDSSRMFRYTRRGRRYIIEQKFTNNKGDGEWYTLIPTSQSQKMNFSLDQGSKLRLNLPEIFKQRESFAWLKEDKKHLYFTNGDNKITYEADKKPDDSKLWTVRDYQTGWELVKEPSVLAATLADLESPDFIVTSGDEKNGLHATLARYQLTFSKPAGKKPVSLQWDGKAHALDLDSPFRAQGIAGLSFDNQGGCVLPVARFLATDERQSEGEYYQFTQDLQQTIPMDVLKGKFSADNGEEDSLSALRGIPATDPDVKSILWQYSGSRQAMVLKMKNGEPYPETPAQALYLCYLYLGSHQEEKALAVLTDCDKRLGGLEGRYEELQYLRWICEALPYQPKNDKIASKAKISTPPVVACQLKAIALLTEFAKTGQAISFPDTKSEPQTSDDIYQCEEVNADKAFYENGVNKHLYSLYQRYQLMRRDMASTFVLSNPESRSLLNYYHDRASDTSDEPVALGALGYDWLRLNFANLKRELSHLQHKEQQDITLTSYEASRKEEIERVFREHEGVYKIKSELVYAPIDLDISRHAGLTQIYEARSAFDDAVYTHQKPLLNKPDKGIYEQAIGLLKSNIEPNIFARNFAVYVSIALNAEPSERKKLERFCKAVLIASRHKPVEKQQNDLPYLCNALYRIICTKKNEPQAADISDIQTAAQFSKWVLKLKPDPVKIPQLIDVTEDILTSAQAVQESLPVIREKEPPVVAMEQREAFEALTLFSEGKLKAVFSPIKNWREHEDNFYTVITDDINLSEEEAGVKKLKSLQALQQLAESAFGDEKTLSELKTATDDRLVELQKLQHTDEEALLALANEGPAASHAKLTWSIDVAAQKRKPLDINRLLALYFQADQIAYREATGLSEEKINALHGQIAVYLQRGLLTQQLARMGTEVQKVLAVEASSRTKAMYYQLGQQVYARNLINVIKDPALAVFQYHENILLRPHQKTGIGHLLRRDDKGHYQEMVAKIVMGGGKSKVLSPNIAYHKANGDNLVVIEVPKALLRTNYVDLKAMSSNLFGQSAVLFEFSRDSDSSSSALKKIFRQFSDAMVNKNYIVTTGGAMLSLELKYLELLSSVPDRKDKAAFQEWEAQVHWAEQLVLMLKNRGDCLIDEVHQGLLLKNKLNYTIGESEPVSGLIRLHTADLYQFMTQVSLEGMTTYTGDARTMGDLLRYHKPFKNRQQYEEACSILAGALLEKQYSPLIKALESYGATLTPAQKDELFAYFFDETSEIPAFVANFSNDLKDILALYKEQLNHLLPFTLGRNCGEHYGPSKNNEKSAEQRAVAIPYAANNAPKEGSDFGNELETVNYTIQSMMIIGVSEALLKEYLIFLKQQAAREAREQQKASMDETATGVLFYTFTDGVSLAQADVDSSEQMRDLHGMLSKNPLLIMEVLKNNVLKNIRVNPTILSANAYGHVDMMHTVQGFSGTPWNASTFHERLHYDREFAIGTDNYIIQSLKAKNTPVKGIDFGQPKTLVEQILSRYKAQDMPRSIIDISAAFKGVDNLTVARQIAQYINQHPEQFNTPEPLQYVLFFNNQNQLSALPVASFDRDQSVIVIGSSDKEIIAQRLGCAPAARFSFYDQAHTLGTDIKQHERAKGVVLSDQDTGISPFLQGVLRNRDVLDGQQTIDVFVPTEMAELDLTKLCQAMQEREKAQLRQDNYLAARYKMSNIIRRDLLARILHSEGRPEDKANLLTAFQSQFYNGQKGRLFERFGCITKLEDTKVLLKDHQANLLANWQMVLKKESLPSPEHQKDTLSEEMDAIIEQTCQPGVCDEQNIGAVKDEGREVELLKENENEVEQMLQKEELSETFNAFLEQPDFCEWRYYGVFQPENLNFKNLKEICQSADPDFVPDFSPDIEASVNFYKIYKQQENYLGMFRMPVHALYFTKDDKGNLKCIILSQQEYKEAVSEIRLNKQGWISTTQNQVLAGTPPWNFKKDPAYQQIIEQVRFFNGELGLLLGDDAPLRWINNDSKDAKEKLDFFEKYLAPATETKPAMIEQFRLALSIQNRMLNFLAQTPAKDFRGFDWATHFPGATAVDIKYIEGVANAFYDSGNDFTDAKALASQYNLSPMALGHLKQYETTLHKKFILACENWSEKYPQSKVNTVILNYCDNQNKETMAELKKQIPSEFFKPYSDKAWNKFLQNYQTGNVEKPTYDFKMPLIKKMASNSDLTRKQYNRLAGILFREPERMNYLYDKPSLPVALMRHIIEKFQRDKPVILNILEHFELEKEHLYQLLENTNGSFEVLKTVIEQPNFDGNCLGQVISQSQCYKIELEKILPIDKLQNIFDKETLRKNIKYNLIGYDYISNWAVKTVINPEDRNKKVANDLICLKAETTNKPGLVHILESVGEHLLSQEIYKAVITNKAVDAEIIKRLNKLDLAALPEIKTHVDCYLQSLQLKDHLEKLNTFIAQNPQITSRQKRAIQGLYNDITKAKNELTKAGNLITKHDIDNFKGACESAIGKHMSTLKKDPGIWHKVHPILRAILGVIAAITLIPAMAVELGTKQGYVNTFFTSSEKEKVEKLRKLGDDLEEKIEKTTTPKKP